MKTLPIFAVCAMQLAFSALAAPSAAKSEYIPQERVKVRGFWGERYKALATKWLPHCIRQMERGGRGEELLNLVATGEVLAGREPSVKFKGCPWSDAYPYNVMESACLALEIDPDGDKELAAAQAFLRRKLEEWIPIVLAAQEESGYIHSFHDLNRKPHFTRIEDHEFYVMGYFIELGIAHYRMTSGKDRRLFDAAIKCADHIDSIFGPAPKRTWMNGHPGLEYALERLSDATGDRKYARLADFFIRHQNSQKNHRNAYDQSDIPAARMSEANGHAVRAAYFYAAMTGAAWRLGDKELGTAGDKLFDSVLNRKYYLTGGIGASEKGEAFGPDYELPDTGYCEACASCGLDFWCGEMRRLHDNGETTEAVRERVAYNILLGAIGRDGESFFYQNPLKSAKRRYPWHACPCCVGNIPRTLFALKDRMWSRSPDGKTLYLDQFIASEGDFDGIHFNLETKYPDSGRVKLTLSSTNAKNGKPFTLAIRFPNRMESALYKAVPEVKGGYVKRTVKLSYGAPEVMEFEMPMPLQKVTAMPEVKDHAGLVAYQRGPIVYSIEDGKKVPNYDRLNGDFTGESSVWISDSSNSSNEEEAK